RRGRLKYTPRGLRGNVNVSREHPLKEFAVLIGGLTLLILLVYALLGLLVDEAASRMPLDLERAMGKLFTSAMDVRERTPAQMELQGILDSLVEHADLPELQYRVYIENSPSENAGALPGGSIVVYSALINGAATENELAFVLAHELGHYRGRDHLRGLGRGLVMVVISAALSGSDSSVTEFLTTSLTSVEMQFSQAQESADDTFALDLLNRRYGHTGGATDFFKRLSEGHRSGAFQKFFSTHPVPPERVEALKERIRLMGYGLGKNTPMPVPLKGLHTE
ncbi:hypothetical protein LCGC14_2043030, partial [marine sediment metagenome]